MLGTIALLFLANIFCFAFKKTLLTLYYESIDSEKKKLLSSHKRILYLLNNTEALFETIKFCQILILFGIGALINPLLLAISQFFNLTLSGGYNAWLFFVLFLFVSCLHLFAFKFFFKAKVTSLSLEGMKFIAVPVIVLEKVLFPFIWIIRYIDLRLFSISSIKIDKKYSPLDLGLLMRGLGYPNASLSTELINIINNAIRLSELEVSDVLLPRSQIHFLDLNASIQENIEKAKSTGHTRFPLCSDGLDHCFGIIHVKDVFLFQGELGKVDLEKFQRKLIRFSINTPVEDALKKFLKFKIHMALVVDDYGTTIGLLTLEDILEELVGNIEDEFDQDDILIIPITKNTYKVSGLTPVHKLESMFGICFENQDVSSFGGLISAELGRIPEKNERIELFGWSIKIIEVSQKRIISAIIRVGSDSDADKD